MKNPRLGSGDTAIFEDEDFQEMLRISNLSKIRFAETALIITDW
jgi:hypothetical protein